MLTRTLTVSGTETGGRPTWPPLGVALTFFVVLTSFAVYLETLAPTVLPNDPFYSPDSPMLQVQAAILGIPNSSGYPTWVMATHMFTYLPFGDSAYRANLASAVYAALAVLFVCLLCRELTKSMVASAAAALLFGTSRIFWSQAVITEVYTLNALLVVLAFFTLLLWRRIRKDRCLLMAAFLVGFSLTGHLTSGLLLPVGLIFVGVVDRRKLTDVRLMLKSVGMFALGLLPYLYLPLRVATDPSLLKAGADPDTVVDLALHPKGLLHSSAGIRPNVIGSLSPGHLLHLLARLKSESNMLAFAPEELPERFHLYLHSMGAQFHPVFPVVAVFGVIYLLLKDRPALTLFGLAYLGWLFWALEYKVTDIRVFFIPTYLVLAVFVAAGLFAILTTFTSVVGKALSPKLAIAAVSCLSALVLASPLLRIHDRYESVDQSKNYAASRDLEAVANHAPQGATIVQHRSPLWYMTLVEHRRRDLHVVEAFPSGGYSARGKRWAKRSGTHLRKGPVYILFPPGLMRRNAPYFDSEGYRLIPKRRGDFYEVVVKERKTTPTRTTST